MNLSWNRPEFADVNSNRERLQVRILNYYQGIKARDEDYER